MLNLLEIKNFTIIEHQTIEFYRGLEIITGETGAGKSLIFDAIHIILGARVNADVIRAGADSCIISAQFDISQNSQAQIFLSQLDSEDTSCVIKRFIYKNKPSKCTLNGSIISQKELKMLTTHLLHIHSQHAHYALTDSIYQQKILDIYAQNETTLAALKSASDALCDTNQAIQTCKQLIEEQADRLSIIDFHLAELDALMLDSEDIATLQKSFSQISKAQDLHHATEKAQSNIRLSDQSAVSQIQHTIDMLTPLADTYPELLEIINTLEESHINIDDTIKSLQSITSHINFDRSAQMELSTLIDQFNVLARKHRVTPDKLPDIQKQLIEQKNHLLMQHDTLKALEKKQAMQESTYQYIANQVSSARNKAAQEMCSAIYDILPKLGMSEAKLQIRVEQDLSRIHALGQDSICFLFSANPGFPLSPIGKVASGGELSRLSLMLELITQSKRPKSALLFDEVDTGVSGKVARDIGFILRTLSSHTQVLCITHLPQIASLAHHHFTVKKETKDKSTTAYVQLLSKTEQIQEVARLLDGRKLNQTAIEQAQSLCEDI